VSGGPGGPGDKFLTRKLALSRRLTKKAHGNVLPDGPYGPGGGARKNLITRFLHGREGKAYSRGRS